MEKNNISCSIAQQADAFNPLIAPVSPQLELLYLNELIKCMGVDKLEVKKAHGKEGKGVFSTITCKRGDVLWQERSLTAMQHQSNKSSAPCCSNCFKYLGSIEHQIGSKLQHFFREKESIDEDEEADEEEMKAASERVDLIKAAGVSEADISDLISGKKKLPKSDLFPLDAPIACGCGEEKYCGNTCQTEFWRLHHSVLCLRSHQSLGDKRKRRKVGSQKSEEGVNQEALREFHELATETNEIFILASRVLVMTALQADELLTTLAEGGEAAASSSAANQKKPPGHAAQEAVSNLLARGQLNVSSASEALISAWLPFHLGWKKLWHEAVACPSDVEDEEAFRSQLKDLATSASNALRVALPALSHKYPDLFSNDVFSSVVAMFELNNLSISPPSPVEDFFLSIDESNDEAIKAETKPFLDALDKAYDERAEGTGFFSLQSLVNHECLPSMIPEWIFSSEDGSIGALASMTCLRDVEPGDELSISYIGEGLEKEERQEKLRDYGFVCNCKLCLSSS